MLKRHIKCLAVLFFLPMFMFHQLQAQPGNDWIVHYGDDELYEGCNKVIPTQDGNYLLVGMSTDDTYDPPCDKDAYVMKVNREGDLIWDRYYGDYLEDYNHDSWEYASDAIELPDSSIILCGAIRNNLYEDEMGLWYCPLALNISGDGNFLWQQLYDSSIGSYFRNIIFLQDEFFALTGGNSRVLYANEDGDSLNVISCGRLIVRDFQHFPDESCSVYLSATSGHYGCDDVEIVKIDLDGNVIWSGVYGTRHDEDPQNMIRTSDGGYAITGYQRNVDDQSIFDTFICRVDPNGEDFWLQTYPHPELDAGRRILQTADGGFIVGGSVTFGNHNPDGVYLMRTDAEAICCGKRPTISMEPMRCLI